jgi:hypothetical protein
MGGPRPGWFGHGYGWGHHGWFGHGYGYGWGRPGWFGRPGFFGGFGMGWFGRGWFGHRGYMHHPPSGYATNYEGTNSYVPRKTKDKPTFWRKLKYWFVFHGRW